MSEKQVLPVSALVARIKNAVQGISLSGIWIQGEISNLTKHRSGHYYFSIKDSQAEISCVMFRSYVARLNFSMEEGMSVLLSGEANVYEQRGQLQFYVRSATPDGIGALYLELEQRKKKLEAEGLFDLSRKKKKPKGILDIAIVTAKEGAALQDVRTTIARRWPMAKLHLYPALVQGKQAPASIVSALKAADAGHHDAILLVRGGGSFEDLFCFNDEQVVRTLADMDTFVVSGVGHEVDTTLADLAADVRAATPTAAAQYITPDQADVFTWISQMEEALIAGMQRRLDDAATKLVQIQANPYLADPKAWCQAKALELETLVQAFSHARTTYTNTCRQDLQQMNLRLLAESPAARIEKEAVLLRTEKENLNTGIQNYRNNQTDRLARLCGLLDAYSPLKVLARGYSLCTVDGNILKSPDQAPAGTMIDIRLESGTLTAQSMKGQVHGN